MHRKTCKCARILSGVGGASVLLRRTLALSSATTSSLRGRVGKLRRGCLHGGPTSPIGGCGFTRGGPTYRTNLHVWWPHPTDSARPGLGPLLSVSASIAPSPSPPLGAMRATASLRHHRFVRHRAMTSQATSSIDLRGPRLGPVVARNAATGLHGSRLTRVGDSSTSGGATPPAM